MTRRPCKSPGCPPAQPARGGGLCCPSANHVIVLARCTAVAQHLTCIPELACVQDSAHGNAGHGSNLSFNGLVECDASVMAGDGAFGALAAAPGKCPLTGQRELGTAWTHVCMNAGSGLHLGAALLHPGITCLCGRCAACLTAAVAPIHGSCAAPSHGGPAAVLWIRAVCVLIIQATCQRSALPTLLCIPCLQASRTQ